jgi:hypothetical protein
MNDLDILLDTKELISKLRDYQGAALDRQCKRIRRMRRDLVDRLKGIGWVIWERRVGLMDGFGTAGNLDLSQ